MRHWIILPIFLLLLVNPSVIHANGGTHDTNILLYSPTGEVQAAIYNVDTLDRVQAYDYVLGGVPVVVYGNSSLSMTELYQPKMVVQNRSVTDTRLVASGLWLQRENGEMIEHHLEVYDYSFSHYDMESIYKWLDDLTELTRPEGFVFSGILTEVDHHEPHGVLESRTEVLKVIDENVQYDWYDVTVTQRLTPGTNYTSSSWEWNWLTYTMNGSLGSSNVYLSEYEPPTQPEPPKGIFSFLWKILGFDLRDYIPWLKPEPRVEGADMSDYSIEVFRVRYSAPRDSKYRDEPVERRYHYVLRIEEDKSPVFWRQTQAQYTQAEDFAQIPYITEPLASGYIKLR